MKFSPLLQAVHSRSRATRLAASVMAAVLSLSLVISLQPCCKLFSPLAESHGHAATTMLHGTDHEHGSSAPVSGDDQDSCTYGIGPGAELAKVVPAIPARTAASPDGALFVVLPLPVFTAVRQLVSPATYHPSPPPFRHYLRFLHLLI